ncbi:MAG: SMC family ATPase [Halobacteriota archaeon]|nr:SMC family ATPase [Halobacteriota archaeon]
MIKLLSLTAKGFKRLNAELYFPERGNLLITGKNESGKSTLFEAIYFALFGTGLVPDRSQKSMRDLLSYESDVCKVSLEFMIDDAHYIVNRKITRTKDDNRRYAHELTITKSGDEVEKIKGSSVSKRVEEELGLDGDAMLNSCFVEQKNLEKLETSKKSERRNSIAKLLNLENFTEIESELHLREKRLEEECISSEKRFNLAKITSEIPKLEEGLKSVEHQQELIAKQKEKKKIDDQKNEANKRAEEVSKDIFEVEQKLKKLDEVEKNIPEKENRLKEFKGLLAILSQIKDKKSEKEEENRILDGLNSKLSRLDELKSERARREEEVRTLESEIKEHQTREYFMRSVVHLMDVRKELLEKLKYNKTEFERLEVKIKQIEKEFDDLKGFKDDLAKRRDEIDTMKRELSELRGIESEKEASRSEIELKLRLFDEKKALEEFKTGKKAFDRFIGIEEEEEKIKGEKRGLQSKMDDMDEDIGGKRRSRALDLTIAIVVSVFGIFTAIVMNMIAYSLISVPIAIFFIYRFIDRSAEIKRMQTSLNSLKDSFNQKDLDLARIEGEKEYIGGREKKTFEDAELRLKDLEISVSTIQDFDLVIGGIASKIGSEDEEELKNTYQIIIKELNDHKTDIKVLESQIEDKVKESNSLNKSIDDIDEEALSITKQRLKNDLQFLKDGTNEVESNLSSVNSDIDQKTDDDEGALRANFEEVKSELTEKRTKITEQKREIDRIEGEIGEVDESSVKVEVLSTKRNIEALDEELSKKMNDADFSARRLEVEPDYDEVIRRTSRLEEEIRNDEEKIRERDELREGKRYKITLLNDLREKIKASQRVIEDISKDLFSEPLIPDISDEEEFNTQKEEILGELGSLMRRRDELKAELGIREDLELEECKNELDRLILERRIHERAIDITVNAKNSIMEKVLPVTEANMTKFLPILTNDNYKDAKINKDSYQIEVYDRRAGGYRPKSVFSGGAKDQFSLALRLSFAMATLPQERGAVPGFIFLDEPIGSFDSDRKAALIELLTRGEIADNFDQVFVISHFPELEDVFDYKIQMEDGVVVEHNMGEVEEEGC